MKVKRVLGVNALCQTGTMDKAVDFFQDVLDAKMGQDKPEMEQYGHRAKDAWLGTEEPFSIEISESVDDELPTGKQHKRYAPSFQFLALEVENLDEAIGEVRAKGINISDKLLLHDPGFGEIYESMIHPKDAFGLIIELIEVKSSTPKQRE